MTSDDNGNILDIEAMRAKRRGSINQLHVDAGLSTVKTGAPVANIDNVVRMLRHLGPTFLDVWADTFARRVYTRDRQGADVREWRSQDDLAAVVRLQSEAGLKKFAKHTLIDGINAYALERRRNSLVEWANGLRWDGVPRINESFGDAFDCPRNEYTQAASANFWRSLAARIYQPGCQVDTMVILEGNQGIGKTNALRVIGGQWYSEALESVTSKDFFLGLEGKLLIEIAELDAFSRAETTRIKQVITCTSDRYRTPYESRAEDHPRHCVFVGTTNEDHYLQDSTGGRRWWPIRCKTVNIEYLKQQREQLFAEAIAEVKRGATWYQMPGTTTAEQEDRRIVDEWENLISEYLFGRREVKLTDIATEALKIDIGKFGKSEQMRIAKVARLLGWKRVTKRDGNEVFKVWVRL